jgi:hypothetical protein
MTKPKLHLDNDTSRKALYRALVDRGHDVTRTPQPDLPVDASDDEQLLWAAKHGRILLTFNIHDFVRLALQYPDHHGIVFAHQDRYLLAALIRLLDCMLSTTTADEWIGKVRWLSDWDK